MAYNTLYYEKTGQKVPTEQLTAEQLKQAGHSDRFIQTATEKGRVSPVSMFSSDSGLAKLNKDQTKLDQFSPTTKPGYVPPATTVPAPTPKVEPKAYFTNEAGQEAEFTESQLKDPKVQKIIQSGNYFQTRTEGPNYNPNADAEKSFKETNDRLESLVNDFLSYNVDTDPVFQSQSASITAQYEQLKKAMVNTNYQRAQAFKTLGYRTGGAQYTGETQLGIEGEELNQANARIAELNRKESDAISAARTAQQTGKYTQFSQQVGALEKIRENKAQELKDYNEKLAKVLENVRKTTIQASRDNAVADLMSQGVTDPKELLNMLNYDDMGNQIGDFTAEELEKTVKSLTGEKDTKKAWESLSADRQDFFVLKESYPETIPQFIKDLPEEQQLGAYVKYASALGRAPEKPSTSVADAINWLYRQPDFSPEDITKFNTDPQFRAFVLRQREIEKANTSDIEADEDSLY